MSSLRRLLALLATASLSEAHLEFIRISHNGVWQPPLQYIRNRTAPWIEAPVGQDDGYREWTFPTFTTDGANSVRCGRDSLTWAKHTDTLKVKAGDEFEFLGTNLPTYYWNDPRQAQWDGCPEGRGGCIPEDNFDGYYDFNVAHDGPASFYISRVPQDQSITSYDGSGEWLKIKTIGAEFRDEGRTVLWLPFKGKRLRVKLPTQTPAGKYLLRIDQVWPGSSRAQHYPACVHIEVEANPNSNPLPTGVKIPEIVCQECPGMTWGSQQTWVDALNGTMYPGGPIWDGETVTEDKIVPVIKDWSDPLDLD